MSKTWYAEEDHRHVKDLSSQIYITTYIMEPAHCPSKSYNHIACMLWSSCRAEMYGLRDWSAQRGIWRRKWALFTLWLIVQCRGCDDGPEVMRSSYRLSLTVKKSFWLASDAWGGDRVLRRGWRRVMVLLLDAGPGGLFSEGSWIDGI